MKIDLPKLQSFKPASPLLQAHQVSGPVNHGFSIPRSGGISPATSRPSTTVGTAGGSSFPSLVVCVTLAALRRDIAVLFATAVVSRGSRDVVAFLDSTAVGRRVRDVVAFRDTTALDRIVSNVPSPPGTTALDCLTAADDTSDTKPVCNPKHSFTLCASVQNRSSQDSLHATPGSTYTDNASGHVQPRSAVPAPVFPAGQAQRPFLHVAPAPHLRLP